MGAYLKEAEEQQRRDQANEARLLRRECYTTQCKCEKYWMEVSMLQKQLLEVELQRAPLSPQRTDPQQSRGQRIPLRSGGKGTHRMGVAHFEPTMSTTSNAGRYEK